MLPSQDSIKARSGRGLGPEEVYEWAGTRHGDRPRACSRFLPANGLSLLCFSPMNSQYSNVVKVAWCAFCAATFSVWHTIVPLLYSGKRYFV